jgi:hypothetical protein
LTDILLKEGFEVEKGAGHETSFVAQKSKNQVLIISLNRRPSWFGTWRNILVLAGCSDCMSKVLAETGGEAVVFGTPAEEGYVQTAAQKAALLR